MQSNERSTVRQITPEDAKKMMAQDDALVVDVREGYELAVTGKVAGAIHVPCGEIALCADPQSPSYDDRFDKDKAVILYCAAGERSGMSGEMLAMMGYEKVYNLGGFADWVKSGGAVERA